MYKYRYINYYKSMAYSIFLILNSVKMYGVHELLNNNNNYNKLNFL